ALFLAYGTRSLSGWERLRHALTFCAVLGASAGAMSAFGPPSGSDSAAHAGLTFYHGNNLYADGGYATPPGFSGDRATQAAKARDFAERRLGYEPTSLQTGVFYLKAGVSHFANEP